MSLFLLSATPCDTKMLAIIVIYLQDISLHKLRDLASHTHISIQSKCQDSKHTRATALIFSNNKNSRIHAITTRVLSTHSENI